MISRALRTPRSGAISVVLAAVVVTSSNGLAQGASTAPAPEARERAPAMQGHDAEARMREPGAEARWRRLFFDAAAREVGEAQVACDHRVARRPEVDGGPAAVAIAWDRASGRVLVRRWETADGAALDLEAVKARVVVAAPAGAIVDGLTFRRCR